MARFKRAHQIVEVLRLHARRHAIERRLRHAVFQHLVDAERRNDLLDSGNRHLQLAVDTAVGVEAERAGGDRDQIALRNPRLHDLDMAARGLDFAKPLRPWLWRKILQAREQRAHVGIERLGKQRMQLLQTAAGNLQRRLDHRMILRRAIREARMQFDMFGARQRRLHRGIDAIDGGIVEHDGGALRRSRASPTMLLRALLQFTVNES